MKKLLSKIFFVCCIASVAMSLVSCLDNDKSAYPSLKVDLVVAKTNSSGLLSKVTLDNGQSYDVASQRLDFHKADTLFRCVASYELDGKKFNIYTIANIFSRKPVPLATFLEQEGYTEETLPRDPVNVVSMWKSGGYINMQLGVLTTNNVTHSYAFCDEGNGHYSLLHRRPLNAAESYTEVVFMSMPIPEGVESLTFSVNTYDGITTRTF